MADTPAVLHEQGGPAVAHAALSLRRCLRVAFVVAKWLMAFSLGLGALVTAAALIVDGRLSVELIEVPEALAVVAAAYFAAAAAGALTFWGLWPLHRSPAGWAVIGILVVASVYGAVSLVSVLAYLATGVDIIGYDSAAGAWSGLISTIAILAAAVGLPVGLSLSIWVADRRAKTSPATRTGS